MENEKLVNHNKDDLALISQIMHTDLGETQRRPIMRLSENIDAMRVWKNIEHNKLEDHPCEWVLLKCI